MTEKKPDPALSKEVEKLLSDVNAALKDRVALRDAVCAYFTAERANGTPIETIIQSVEDILDRAEARASGHIVGRDGQRELSQQLVDWCVEFHRENIEPNS